MLPRWIDVPPLWVIYLILTNFTRCPPATDGPADHRRPSFMALLMALEKTVLGTNDSTKNLDTNTSDKNARLEASANRFRHFVLLSVFSTIHITFPVSSVIVKENK